MRETVLSPVAPQGFPGQTNLIDFGFDGFPDPYHAAPGLELLKSATFFIDAANAKDGDAYAFNQGTGGFALNARYGSSLAIGASDTNDPLLLPWTGENYVYLPGVAGNYASTPQTAAYNITSDLELVCRVSVSDWASGTNQVLISRVGTSGQYTYEFVNLNGAFGLFLSTDGTTFSNTYSTAHGLVNGQTYWVKVVRVTSSGVITWYKADDQATEPVSWTTIFSSGAVSAGSLPFASTEPLYIGGRTSAQPLAGRMYRAIIRNGIGGTTVFDANFTTGITSGSQTTFTESSSNAATVTINRATAGRKSVAVTRPTWLFGTDDYMEVADNALLNMDATQSFTVVAVVRQWATAVANGRYLAKGASAAANAYALLGNATSATLRIDDMAAATASGVSSTATAGTLRVYSGVRDKTTRTVTTYANTVAGTAGVDATVEQFTNAFPMRIGADGGASPASYQDFELLAVAVFRRSLTATEIAAINTYYGTA